MSATLGFVATLAEMEQFYRGDKAGQIIELMNKTNDIMDDVPWMEANQSDGHLTRIRTGLPAVYWRRLYQGTPPAKSQWSQVKEGCGILEAIMELDVEEIRLYGNQLYTLELAFTDRPDATLTAGMNVEVEIVSADSTAAHGHTVPLRALFNDGQNACVWVMQGDSTVVKRPVTIDGSLDNSRAVVTDGLTGDELIVRAGVNVLQQGEKVKVVEEPSKTNIGGIL